MLPQNVVKAAVDLLYKFENDMTMPHFSGNPNFSQQKSLQPRWQSETSFTLWPVSAQLSKQRKSGVLPVREGTFSIYIHLPNEARSNL